LKKGFKTLEFYNLYFAALACDMASVK